MPFSFFAKNKYKKLDEHKELEEFDENALLNAEIKAAEITATQSGEISDQIAFVKLLLKKEPGNQSYIQNLQDLKAKAAVLAAEAEAEADKAEGSEGSGSEGSVNFADDGGKKSRYSRKSKSKYSRKSKSKYSRKY